MNLAARRRGTPPRSAAVHSAHKHHNTLQLHRRLSMTLFRPTTRRTLSLLLLLGLGLALSTAASAQSGPTGSLTGVVLDPNGAAVPAASVTVKHAGTGLTRTAAAEADGRWTIPALPVGNYDVLIEAQGFRRTQLQHVSVEASIPRTLDARLEVGEITGEVVNVT